MKNLNFFLTVFIGIIALVVLNSCTKDSNENKANGNLLVWTNSNTDDGALVWIKNGPLNSNGETDFRRFNSNSIKTNEPNCGDPDSINFDLPPGDYIVKDNRSSANETPVTIVSGGCTKLNLATVNTGGGGTTVGYGSVRFGTNNTTNLFYGQPIQITKNGVVIGIVNNTNVCSGCTSCNGSVGLDNLRADTGVGDISGVTYKAVISTRAVNGHPSITVNYSFGISIGQCSYVSMTY